MASLTDRPRKRLSSKPRRDAVAAHHRHQAQQPGPSRRQLKRIGGQLPAPLHAVFAPLESALTRPTARRLVLLALAAILTTGGRTIANLLRNLGALAPGHPSSYHRVFSRNRWSLWGLARRFIAVVLARFVPRGPILLAGDDTVTEHPG